MAELLIRVAAEMAEKVVQMGVHESKMGIMARILIDEIPYVRVLLEDAERRQLSEEIVKKWLEDVKDQFYDMIDVLDEWGIAQQKISQRNEKRVRFLGFPLSFVHRASKFLDPIDFSMKLGNPTEIMDSIREDAYKLRLRPRLTEGVWGGEAKLERRYTHSFVTEAATVYGRNVERATLISKLVLCESSQEQLIHFLSIVGMAGMGKTTVAQVVYNSPEVQKHFELSGWISLSHEFNLFRIALEILKRVTDKAYPKDEDELEVIFQLLRQAIEGKRYLLVLDDVWNEDDSIWEQLKQVFKCGAAGSAILITTRMELVALKAGSTDADIMHLGGLSENECWRVIRDYAFGPSTDEQLTDMFFNNFGRQVVTKCEGLPVMAKLLGTILFSRTSVQEWEVVLNSNLWELSQTNLDVISSLMLSYCHLPPELKQCLLYCSIFPKNNSIEIDKLIKLWIAQDYVGVEKNEMEKEGQRYFEGLLNRSFFREIRRDHKGNLVCKLEGAIVDLIQLLAKNECFIMQVGHKESKVDSYAKKAHHWTLNVEAQASLPASIPCTEKLHTLMICSEYSSAGPGTLSHLFCRLRRLRALDLSSCSIQELPSEVGKLLHLRFLDLSFNRDLKELPEAICDLSSMQTLNLNGCDDLRKLPKGMGKLIHLRHLEILWTTSLSYLPKGIGCLTSLRTLNRFFGNGVGSKACHLEDMGKFNYLQGYISIDGLGGVTDVTQAVRADLKNKMDLLGLDLWFSRVGPEWMKDGAVLEAMEPPPNLECLGIYYYKGIMFPCWITALERLRELMVFDCSACEILPPLGKLPSLESMEIRNLINVKKVGPEFLGLEPEGVDGSNKAMSEIIAFPKLKNLHFHMLTNWEEWNGLTRVENVSIMPLLSSLSIVKCTKLRAVPTYLETQRIQEIVIEECPILNKELSRKK